MLLITNCMESESNIQETSKRKSLESRLGIMVFNSAVSGFLTYGIMDQVSRGDYFVAAILASFGAGSAINTYYHGKKAIEDYRK